MSLFSNEKKLTVIVENKLVVLHLVPAHFSLKFKENPTDMYYPFFWNSTKETLIDLTLLNELSKI